MVILGWHRVIYPNVSICDAQRIDPVSLINADQVILSRLAVEKIKEILA